MEEKLELINFAFPKKQSSIIKVIGIGGGGGNAVNHMFTQGIKDVSFVVCNTDAQDLEKSPVPVKIQLGVSLTKGKGAGNKPEIGKQAAIENLEDINEVLSGNTKMVFITAGMGGGTGTGASPVIAKAAKELDILTVAIVTIPFMYEGQRRINQALEGIAELKKYVDSLLVINNEKLYEFYGKEKLSNAFSKADDVLTIAAKGIAEIITVPGIINVDFADVHTVMNNSGVAIMGSATAEGEKRAVNVIQNALTSPLLNDNDITGAKNILLNITSGTDEMIMEEVGQISEYVQQVAGENADVISGYCKNEILGNKISVIVIATGFETNRIPEYAPKIKKEKEVVLLDEHSSLIDNNESYDVSPQIAEANTINESQEQTDKHNNETEPFVKINNTIDTSPTPSPPLVDVEGVSDRITEKLHPASSKNNNSNSEQQIIDFDLSTDRIIRQEYSQEEKNIEEDILSPSPDPFPKGRGETDNIVNHSFKNNNTSAFASTTTDEPVNESKQTSIPDLLNPDKIDELENEPAYVRKENRLKFQSVKTKEYEK